MKQCVKLAAASLYELFIAWPEGLGVYIIDGSPALPTVIAVSACLVGCVTGGQQFQLLPELTYPTPNQSHW